MAATLAPARTTRVVLIDEHALLRGGMRAIIEAHDDLRVVGEASDGVGGVDLVLETHPDVVVMAAQLPRLDGIEATRRLCAAGTRARILMISDCADDECLLRALHAGAAGAIARDAAPDRLTEAVRGIANGESVVSSAVTQKLIEGYVDQALNEAALKDRFSCLTDREEEILTRMTRGMSNGAIAAEMYLSEATVKTHVTRILSKLDVESRLQAVVLAYESGFVRPGQAMSGATRFSATGQRAA